MAYIKSIDIVYNEMQRQSIRLWQVFDQNKQDIIGENSDEENISIADSIEELKSLTDTLEGMIYIIIRRDGSAPKRKATPGTQGSALMDVSKGIYRFQVLLGETTQQKNSNNQNIFGNNQNLISMVLNANKENFELQIKHLEEKKELESRFEERIRKMEEKISGKGGENTMLSEAYAAKGLELLERILSKK